MTCGSTLMAERHNSKTSHISCASEMVMKAVNPIRQSNSNGDITAQECAMNSISSRFGRLEQNSICTTCDRRSDDPVTRCCVAANCGRLDRLGHAA